MLALAPVNLGVGCLLSADKAIMKEAAKTFLLRLFDPRSIILGVAVYNFSVIWTVVANWSLDAVVDPWFISWSFTNAPTRLLVAAVCLRLEHGGSIW